VKTWNWKRILKFVAVMSLVVAVLSTLAGSMAIFADAETSQDNYLEAGTLNLTVDGQDDPNVVHITLRDLAPGWSGCYKWDLVNTGSIEGELSVEFSAINNQENGTNEPEDDAEAQSYASAGGELGEYLKTCSGRGGWGCTSCTIANHLMCSWQTGPTHPWGTPGLNGFGGQSYSMGITIDQGEKACFILQLSLEDDLRLWDGTKWLDVDDNIIQSDSIEVSITFHLDQVQPYVDETW